MMRGRQVGLSFASMMFCSMMARPVGVFAFPVPFQIAVKQIGATAGDPTYTMAFQSLQSFDDLTGPDGTSYSFSNLTGNLPSASSYADFSTRYFGTWVLHDHLIPNTTSNYSFTLSPLSLDSIFHDVPQVISPANGATVGKTFDIQWQYPDITPTAKVATLSGANASFVFSTTSTAVTVNVTSSTATPLSVLANVGYFADISQIAGSVTPIGTPGMDTYSISRVNFDDLSPTLSLTVIPEPTSIAAVASGMAVVLTFRSAKRRRR